MIHLGGPSKWTWNTSGSGGVSLDAIAATGGILKLYDPQGKDVSFFYGGLGQGLSTPGIKIPKLGSVLGRLISKRELNATGGGTDLWNTGIVLKSPLLGRKDLLASDFRGPCVLADFGLETPIHGWAVTAFFLGVDLANLMDLTNLGTIVEDFLSGEHSIIPKAVILSRGDVRGVAFGGNAYLGMLL